MKSFKRGWLSLRHASGRRGIGKRHILYGVLVLILLGISASYMLRITPYGSGGSIVYARARVVENQINASVQYPGSNQTLEAVILDGADKGKRVTVTNSVFLNDPTTERLAVGKEIVLTKNPLDGNQYLYEDNYRIPGAIVIFLILLALVIIIGRWRGFTALVGLTLSITVLVVFVIPRIVAGHSTLAVCIEGALLISTATLFIAHGFNRRTTVAFLSACITLVAVIGISMASISLTALTGYSDENSFAIQAAAHPISLSGLLLGGIIIASLGVLDDITTGQAAVVDELYKANTKLTTRELYRAGLSVGREHIAALINTLALAYVGVSLPTIVITVLYNHLPLVLVLNNEAIMEEIVRTGVASIGLLLAVPIATLAAAYILPRWRARNTAEPTVRLKVPV